MDEMDGMDVFNDGYPLKNEIKGGGPVWNFNFGFHFFFPRARYDAIGLYMTAMVAPSSMGIQSYYVTWHMIFQGG